MTPIPPSLNALIAESLEAMENDPDRELSKGRREAILWAFGPYLFAPGNTDRSGYVRRLRLAVLAVERVLPHWQAAFPDDETPVRLLARAEWVRDHRDQIEPKPVTREIEAAWEAIEKRFVQTYNIAAAVGFAAARTLSLALWDGFTDDDDIDYSRFDSQDFESNDVHCLAAAVHAGGPVYAIEAAPDPDLEKRTEFWRWWLTEAVPAAWRAFG